VKTVRKGLWAPCSFAQATRAKAPPDLAGVYQSIPNAVTLPGGLKNAGSPSEISLLPKAAAETKSINLKDDPLRACSPIGEFRLMARDGLKIELAPAPGLVAMLFENTALGAMRIVHMNRGHVAPPTEGPEPVVDRGGLWLGDSIGRWEGDTLVVDTTEFSTRTWLNEAGAQHSEALHLIERIRPILKGQFLEYEMTAEDPMALAKPYTYRRYYEKLNSEIGENVCQDEN